VGRVQFDDFVHKFAVSIGVGGIFFDIYLFTIVINVSEDKSSDVV
jgi:hypothetical protein